MPWLAGKISPDGRRFAVPADRGDGVTRILIVSLVDGALAWLKTDDTKDGDTQPVWDPSGKQIAFVRATAANQASLWAVNVDGARLRRITDPVAQPMYLHTWTPDGGAIAFYQGIGYDVISVATGARSHASDLISADASWRAASPSLLATASTSINFGSRYQVVLAPAPDGARTVIVETAAAGVSLGGPRWRPGRDEFLYTFYDSGSSTRELRIRSLSGAERRFALDGGSPTWTTDGAAIVYLRGETAPIPGEGSSTLQALVLAEIRVMGADGSGDRTLYRTPSPAGALPPNWCVCNDALAVRKL
jgi:Tol biopolymer transport system component